MKFNRTQKEYRALNDFLRGELKRQKISQSDLGYRLNLSHVAISKRLSGQTEWTVWELINVFEILNVEFDYGLRGMDRD